MHNSTQDIFNSELKKAGFKNTYPRARIFSVLENTRAPIGINEIITKALDINHTTVYRNIYLLQKAGIVAAIPYGFKYRYELSDIFKPHHHHVLCQACNKSQSLNVDSIEKILKIETEKLGFKPTGHHIEVFGTCSNCLNK